MTWDHRSATAYIVQVRETTIVNYRVYANDPEAARAEYEHGAWDRMHVAEHLNPEVVSIEKFEEAS